MKNKEELIEAALGWFKELLKIDTSNPPGNERQAVEYIASVLKQHGIEPQILAKEESRSNIFAQMLGASDKPPLLLSSHIDVVPVEDPHNWSFPPFGAQEYDQMVWGRGTLDVKYKTAFDMALLIYAREHKLTRTLKMVALADEELGQEFGSRFVTEKHFELIRSEYVINEVGGFNVRLGARDIIPIQVGEKSFAHVRFHVNGPSAHGSIPLPNSSVALLGQLLTTLHDSYLGFHPCASSSAFFESVADGQPEEIAAGFKALLTPDMVEDALALIGDPLIRTQLRAMLCHTVNPTRLGGGFKVTVVPEAVWADCDCRIIPDVEIKHFVKELGIFLQHTLGEAAKRIEIELVSSLQGYEIDGRDALIQHIGSVAEASWNTVLLQPKAAPMLMPASSDNSVFVRAGIKPIGFAPLLFPPDFPGFALAHAANERVPISAFRQGLSLYLDSMAGVLGIR